MKIMLTGCCLSLLLALACQNRPAASSPAKDSSKVAMAALIARDPDTTKLAGAWYLQPVLPADTAAGKTPFLYFEPAKKKFFGNTGCNNMHGEFWYSDNDSSLTFSDKLATTRMFCTGYDEKAFLKSLMHATHYRLKNGMLILLADDNSELSRWIRKPVKQAAVEKA